MKKKINCLFSNLKEIIDFTIPFLSTYIMEYKSVNQPSYIKGSMPFLFNITKPKQKRYENVIVLS